jgi:isochorismate synthase
MRVVTLGVTTPIMEAMSVIEHQPLRVEQVAAIAGVSVDTVRYYQKLGVLHPPARHGRTAVYDQSHLDRLAEVRELSDDGFTLSQIQRLSMEANDPLLSALAGPAVADRSSLLSFDELVRATGVHRDLVRLAIDAGLVSASPDSADRFGPDAVTMLASASTILDAGLPVDELATIALRHASNVEGVVDEAIEVFRRHLPAGTPAEQGDIVARLVPAVSDLVSLHFRRTLIDRATSRLIEHDFLADLDLAKPAGRGWFCEWSELAEPLDLVAVGRFVRDDHRFLWLQPGDALGIIAWGEIATWAPSDGVTAGGFSAQVRAAMPDTPTPPVIVGGFAFDQSRPATLPWSKFGAGRLIVPATQIIRRHGRLYAMAFGTDRDQARLRLEHAHNMVEAAQHRGELALGDIDFELDDTTQDHYRSIVANAVATIGSGELDKVVLARSIAVDGDVPLGAWLSRLRARFPTCAVFARGEGSRTFFGASPEVLVRVTGERVDTAAVAGTRPRSADPEHDVALANELLTSVKEQHEHRVVIDSIRSKLAGAGVHLEDQPATEVLQLPGIQHLYTPVVGRRGANTTIVDLVELLHPTPAVGGAPHERAVEWIRDHEQLDRGWYAAPVGWTDIDGNGEFRVGLRSGLHGPDRTLLFAGCGIVAGSDPDEELEETMTKFGALLGAIAP